MTKDPLAPETLAAFLDGTLSAEERATVLAAVAKSDSARKRLIEISSLMEQADAAAPAAEVPTPTAPSVRPLEPAARKQRRRWPMMVVPALLAASLVMFFAFRGDDVAHPPVLSPARAIGQVYGANWNMPGWSEQRGTSSDRRPQAELFRVGVRYSEVEAAFGVRDSAAIAAALRELLTEAANIRGARQSIMAIQARGAAASAEQRAQLAADLRQPRDATWSGWFDIGVWTERARLALLRGDSALANTGAPSAEELERLVGDAARGNRSTDAADATVLEHLRRVVVLQRGAASSRAEIPVALAIVIKTASR